MCSVSVFRQCARCVSVVACGFGRGVEGSTIDACGFEYARVCVCKFRAGGIPS